MTSKAVVKTEPAALAATEPSSLSQIIALARDKDMNVDVLERLVAMSERQADRVAAQDFHEAMARFQEKCPRIPHSASADFPTKSGVRMAYTYAELHQIAETIRPYLHENGLSYSWDSAIEGDAMRVVCRLSHSNGHSRTATFEAPTANSNPGMSDLQKHAGALTFGRRQSLVQVLGLTTCDPDADGASVETITDDQVRVLNKMILETGTNAPRFLAYLKVAKLADLRAADFTMAVAALEQKNRDNVAARKGESQDLLTDAGGAK